MASNPSTFQMTDVKLDENDSQNLSIICKNEDLNLNLETISYFKTLNHLKQATDINFNLADYWSNLDLIVCETNVDLSTLALLYDSFYEKDNKSVNGFKM